MGDPRKIRKKYSTPKHPWIATRIEEERVLKREYGLGNKKEIWKMESILKRFKGQAKKLVATVSVQGQKEQEQLFNKVIGLGLIKQDGVMDDILSLHLKNLLDRRLQTILVKKNLARSMKQARQLIVHEHIVVNGKKVTSPSYLVKITEESSVGFSSDSKFLSEDHPERFSEAELQAKKQKEQAKLAAKEAIENPEEDILVIDEKDLEEAEVVTEGKKKKVETKKSEVKKPVSKTQSVKTDEAKADKVKVDKVKAKDVKPKEAVKTEESKAEESKVKVESVKPKAEKKVEVKQPVKEESKEESQ